MEKAGETWELVQGGDDPTAPLPPLQGWDFLELGTLLKWFDPPPPKINFGLFLTWDFF